ncbi:MAG: hypothetical protein COU29_01955 [Candidatus Magasanikbacteria bacterium CG10_big_fil_rev_8_21_14_0_10_36_32]|uniref:Uncharacterized protein n=1 Tax=Candidatus Magasanikbacteria bacterium CG10_big_fil_rev_8_21_14_0_10_36_32 TaxID=1974646 RepID=A0A2M6W6W9_9BACT|nr:MAG: hypothetical protein COU29_01955 [Candidatus Magasanikbacteria bacterium CG10_big_fil_rev_8_21_14_0_10_36_32]
MTKEKELHTHPKNPNEKIFGQRLQAGDIVEEDDVYDSSSGKWEVCPCPGLTLQESVNTYWVRPDGITAEQKRHERLAAANK